MKLKVSDGELILDDGAKPSIEDKNCMLSALTPNDDNGAMFQRACDIAHTFPDATNLEFHNAAETWLRNASRKPNYRVYDRTGGGVEEDFYADSLEAAIVFGRNWIEDGDWEKDTMETPLDCEIGPLIRHVFWIDRYSAGVPVRFEGPFADIDEARDNVGPLEEIAPTEYDGAVERCYVTQEMMGLKREDVTVTAIESYELSPDSEDYTTIYEISGQGVEGAISADLTQAADRDRCDGTCPAADPPDCKFQDLVPEGEEVDECGHSWTSNAPVSVLGGIKENPGVWGSGHGGVSMKEVCRCCGMYKTTDNGATLPSNGTQATSISYEDADEASLKWEGLFWPQITQKMVNYVVTSEGKITGEFTVRGREYSALWTIDEDGKPVISETDSDTLPDSAEGWPEPPEDDVLDAEATAKALADTEEEAPE